MQIGNYTIEDLFVLSNRVAKCKYLVDFVAHSFIAVYIRDEILLSIRIIITIS